MLCVTRVRAWCVVAAQTIQAAEEGKMIPVSVLNGNVVIETSFYDDDLLVCKMVLRVWYDL